MNPPGRLLLGNRLLLVWLTAAETNDYYKRSQQREQLLAIVRAFNKPLADQLNNLFNEQTHAHYHRRVSLERELRQLKTQQEHQ